VYPIPEDEAALRILLNGLTGIGPVTVRRLHDAFAGNLQAAMSASVSELMKVKGIGPTVAEVLRRRDFDVSAEQKWAADLQLRILTGIDDAWPEALAPMWDPPLALYAEGNALPPERSIAIVGSRRCTPYGLSFARRLSAELARRDWWIISGLAQGIDQAAHEGALEGGGWTAAVLGHGLDRTHPPDAWKLRRRISERGCIISEFPLGRPPDRQSFPQRNRLVAALSRCVIVIETDLAGGSLITARFALELGRPVCVLPGRVDSPASRGCHALIRDGATLITSADEILEELGEFKKVSRSAEAKTGDIHAHPWLQYFVGGEAHDADSLAIAASASPDAAAGALTLLEIEGRLIRRLDGRHELI
jgi:DNA processing protein